MKTPYNSTIDPRQDRIIFEEEERLMMMGYTFLGWNPDLDIPQYKHCIDEAHNYHAVPNTWSQVRHHADGADTTQWCDKDKIYWKVDLHDEV